MDSHGSTWFWCICMVWMDFYDLHEFASFALAVSKEDRKAERVDQFRSNQRQAGDLSSGGSGNKINQPADRHVHRSSNWPSKKKKEKVHSQTIEIQEKACESVKPCVGLKSISFSFFFLSFHLLIHFSLPHFTLFLFFSLGHHPSSLSFLSSFLTFLFFFSSFSRSFFLPFLFSIF